jgi:hypothetical protein
MLTVLLVAVFVAIGLLIFIGVASELFSRESHKERAERAEAKIKRGDRVSEDRLSEWDGGEVDPSKMDRITRRALKKAGRLPPSSE